MNIFRVVNTVLYPLFIFLLLFSGRNLVESTDKSAGASPGSGAGTPSTPPDKTGPASTPPPSTNESQPASATPPASHASGTDDKSKGSETTTPKTGVELSLKATAESNEFEYKKDSKIVTYTAKDTYGFKSVKTGDTVVWSTDNASEYATKVVLNGKGNKKKTVTIHLPSGTTKSYKKDGKNKPWNEYTGTPPSTDNAKSTNESDGSGFELNIKPDKLKSDDDNFEVQKSHGNEVYLITFKSGVKCSSVKVEDKEVWQYGSSESKDSYPKKVTYCKNDDRVTINFEGKDISYSKSGDKWEVKVASKVSTTNSSGTGGGTGTGTGTPGSGTPESRGGTGTGTPASRDGTGTGGGTRTGTDPSRGGTGTGTGGGTHTGGSAQGGGGTHTGSGGSPPANESSARGGGTGTGGSAHGRGNDQTSGGRR